MVHNQPKGNGVRYMNVLTVCGKRGLFGSVRIPGAKNSALPLLAASVLCHGSVTLTHVPRLSDVAVSVQILQSVGCGVTQKDGCVTVTPPQEPGCAVSEALMRTMRSSLFYLAPLLARTGRAEICTPGGCRLGARPIDLHLSGLAQMGARVEEKGDGTLTLTAPRGLAGAEIALRFPSVGATETLLMAASSARGETILRGAAIEPEVTDLARFLQSAGAKITGIGTRTLRVRGSDCLMGTRYAVCPDRITAATVLCAVAGCGGEVLLTDLCSAHLAQVLQALRGAGCSVSASGETSVALSSDGRLDAIKELQTGVYPGFATDAAPLLAAALLRARGESAVTDTIFENRFACAQGFAALGADAAVQGRTLRIRGVKGLTGGILRAPDLRGGAALVIAALQAAGESRILGAEHIDRGYEDIAALFASLGAKITYTKGSSVQCGE